MIGDLLTIPNVMMGIATDQLNASVNEIQQLKQNEYIYIIAFA